MITPTLDLERSLAAQGYDLIAGFDEVGRGALAGPVMVGCAAIWARDLEPLDGDDAVELSGRTYLGVPDGVADSKMLTEHRREAIFDELRDWCAAYAVGQASNTEIDEWGHHLRAWRGRPARAQPSRTRTWLTTWRGIDDKKRLRGSLRGRLWKVVRETP
ncbi:ribonuclease HII [Bifidobacterium longum subsp. longum]|nr:ribonuclease HII [Bifidobacterium longum subsp. longum]